MLQQILKDMYIDPDVLEALNEEQKKILFLKMREEQVRRWKEREEKLEREGGAGLRPRRNKAHCKTVSWLLGHDGDVLVDVIGEAEEVSASQLILSKIGQMKGANLKNDTRNQSNAVKSSLVNGACSEPAKTPSQTSHGIQLQFEGVNSANESNQQPPNSQDIKPISDWRKPAHNQTSENLNSSTHLPPLQNSQDLKTASQSPPLQDPEEEDEKDDFTIAYRSHLCRESSPPSIADRLRQVDTLCTDLESDRLRLLLAQDEQRQLENVLPNSQTDGAEVGKPRRAGTVVRGRVAMLRQAFNSPMPPQGTLSRPKKPPLPAKPPHLLFASPPNR